MFLHCPGARKRQRRFTDEKRRFLIIAFFVPPVFVGDPSDCQIRRLAFLGGDLGEGGSARAITLLAACFSGLVAAAAVAGLFGLPAFRVPLGASFVGGLALEVARVAVLVVERTLASFPFPRIVLD